MSTPGTPSAFPYDELARRKGIEVPTNAWTEAAGPLDLTGRWLFAPRHPWIVERLCALPQDEEAWTAAVHEALRALFGRKRCAHLCATGEHAVTRALDAARRATGRSDVVWFGPDAPDGVTAGNFVDVARAFLARHGSFAAVVMAPGDNGSLGGWWRQALQARLEGAWIVLDERRSACRLSGGVSPLAQLVEPDAVIFGENLACGVPFGAVLEREASEGDPTSPASVSLAFAAATLATLRDEPAYARLAAAGEAIRTRFAARCRCDEVHAVLDGPPGMLRIEFAGHEGTYPHEMRERFGRELEARGVRAGDVVYPVVPVAEDDDLAPRVFAEALGGVRTLLEERDA